MSGYKNESQAVDTAKVGCGFWASTLIHTWAIFQVSLRVQPQPASCDSTCSKFAVAETDERTDAVASS